MERSGVRSISLPSTSFLKRTPRSVISFFGQREDLEAAAVGQDRAVPAHEGVQPAELADERFAGAQRQVIGVREHDLGAGGAHLIGRQRLERAVRADGHEGGRREAAVRRREVPGAGEPAAGVETKVEGIARHGAGAGARAP